LVPSLAAPLLLLLLVLVVVVVVVMLVLVLRCCWTLHALGLCTCQLR
jgi:hypothetical protein